MSSPPSQSHERYERIFAEVEAPFAFVDLDAMWANAAAMLARAGGKPIRVATKSIRCRALLEAILRRDDGFAGLMTFTLPETLWLAEQGFEDLLLAYPTADIGGARGAGAALGRQPGGGADRDRRLRRAPRRDRVGARRRGGAGPRLHRRRRRLVGARRPDQGRAEALAGPHRRAGGGAGAGDRAAAADRTRRADGLRGADRRRRRPAAGAAPARGADPLHAAPLGCGAGRAARRRSSPRWASSSSWRSSTAAAPAASS